MATTRNQDLQASINQMTYEIASTNSYLAQLETHVEHKFDTMDTKFVKNQISI
jgi:flagellar capping protein FliD